MCPPGHHVIHAYAAANEPYEQYEQWAAKDKDKSKEGQRGIDGGRKGEEEREAVATTTAVTAETAVGRKISKEKYEEYKKYKAERCEFLWAAIERSIPDVRSRVVIGPMEGSPLTHARFNRRYKGTYGPRLRAGKEKFPYPKVSYNIPILSLYLSMPTCLSWLSYRGLAPIESSGTLDSSSLLLSYPITSLA